MVKITRSETLAIRHPEALRAFKAALNGQTISEYEPNPIKPDFGLSMRDRDFGIDKYPINKIYYFEDKKRLFDEPREPTNTCRSCKTTWSICL